MLSDKSLNSDTSIWLSYQNDIIEMWVFLFCLILAEIEFSFSLFLFCKGILRTVLLRSRPNHLKKMNPSSKLSKTKHLKQAFPKKFRIIQQLRSTSLKNKQPKFTTTCTRKFLKLALESTWIWSAWTSLSTMKCLPNSLTNHLIQVLSTSDQEVVMSKLFLCQAAVKR